MANISDFPPNEHMIIVSRMCHDLLISELNLSTGESKYKLKKFTSNIVKAEISNMNESEFSQLLEAIRKEGSLLC